MQRTRILSWTLVLVVGFSGVATAQTPRVSGRVTECGEAGTGYRVEVHARVNVGYPWIDALPVIKGRVQKLDQPQIPKPIPDRELPWDDEPPPPPSCRGQTQIVKIGDGVTGADGRYTAMLTLPTAPSGSCEFNYTENIFVRIFDPATDNLIHTSNDFFQRTLNAYDFVRDCRNPSGDIVSIRFETQTISGDGTVLTGVVTLDRPAVAPGLNVQLVSSRPELLEIPRSVVVPGRSRSVSFQARGRSALSSFVHVFATAKGETVNTTLGVSPALYKLGDTNDDNSLNIADAVSVLNYLFAGVDGDLVTSYADFNLDARLDIADGLSMLNFLFGTGAPPPECADPPVITSASREFVTDGEQIFLGGHFPDQLYRITLRGYKYTQGPLFNIDGRIPFSFEREQIHCSCQIVTPNRIEEVGDLLTLSIPLDAPSGEYEIVLIPADGAPSCSEIVASSCADEPCQSAPWVVFVRPSYITSLLSEMEVIGNGEDNQSSAELSFTFNSYFGTPVERANGTFNFPVEFAGHYPGGREGSAHLTMADDTTVQPDVPLFIGPETRMDPLDCLEECAAAINVEDCMSRCAEQEGTYTPSFEAAFAGVETDAEKWWSGYVGVASSALICYGINQAGGLDPKCQLSAHLGEALQSAVKSKLDEDDEFMGSRLYTWDRSASTLGWGIGSSQGPFTLNEAEDAGPINTYVENRRVGSPRVLSYNVRVNSVELLEGYEDCSSNGEGMNELFLEARVTLYRDDRAPRDSTRYPDGETHYPAIQEGGTLEFAGGLDIQPESINSGGFGEDSPLLYVEIAVWEKDDSDEQRDLIGIHSRTYFVAELLSGSTLDTAVEDLITSGGQLTRSVTRQQRAEVNGWWGSDCADCRGFLGGPCPGPYIDADSNGTFETYVPEQGRAVINYEIQMTALKYPRMF